MGMQPKSVIGRMATDAPESSRSPRVQEERGRPLVLVLDADPLMRADLSRALVSYGFDVCTSLEEPDASGRPGLAIVHAAASGAGDSDASLQALARTHPGLPVIVRADSPRRAAELASRLGFDVVEAYEATMPFRSIIARARAFVAARARADSSASFEVDGPRSADRIVPEAMRRVPVLLIPAEDIGWFDGTEQEAALLGVIDGRSDLAALARRCGLTSVDALRVVEMLVTRALVRLEGPASR
jgi:hypothetical protein